MSSSISGTVTNCGGIVSSIKKYNELGVVAIKFDKEINPIDHRPLHNRFIEYDANRNKNGGVYLGLFKEHFNRLSNFQRVPYNESWIFMPG